MDTITLTLVDGVKIVVPDAPDLITPYVLREQQDWFEDEIRFLRRLLQPGQKVIDIGANYGVYTLCMARAVGPTGHVWAFEPTSATAEILAAGIAVNGFTQVTLQRSALSSASGTAQLTLNDNSELNALVRDAQVAVACETVPLVTLDESMASHGWHDIDFVKIDAEGEEANILKGGKQFFAELSPLVQYEVKAGAEVHLELQRAFAALGYDSYRLVPGLGLLVPFDTAAPPDDYLLNLFCCKPDCAVRLAARGALLTPADLGAGDKAGGQGKTRAACDWHTLTRFPYGAGLAGLWEETMAAGASDALAKALALYAASRDASSTPAERFRALAASFMRISFLCERSPSKLRLASLARIAVEYGARDVAVDALAHLSTAILEHHQVDPSEPFLAPCARFDAIPPGEALGNWLLAAVLEEFEQRSSYSSFYAGESARERLRIIHDLGFGSEEMARRLRLVEERFGSSTTNRATFP